VTLYALHAQSHLYVLLYLKFASGESDEYVSLYLSASASSSADDLADRKLIRMGNATDPDNDYSEYSDWTRTEDGDFVDLGHTDDFLGNSSIEGTANYRVYEFKVPFTPTDTGNNTKLELSKQYAVRFGHSNTGVPADESLSAVVLLQVGPTVEDSDEEINEFPIDLATFQQIMQVVSVVAFVAFGAIILKEKLALAPLPKRVLEEAGLEPEDDESDEEAEEDEDSEEEDN
jgi:hypothetical protein